MNIRDAYDRWATTYDADRNLTRDLDADVARATLASLHTSRVLEIGCGTGKNTIWLADVACSVLALDFSPGMLRTAHARLRAASAPNVALALADLTRPWPCAAGWADLVICDLVLEHLTDLGFVFWEARRVLSRDGLFFICELHPFRQYEGKRAGFRDGAERVEIPAATHHLTDFVETAAQHSFSLRQLKEWWHEEDRGAPPRLVSFLFAQGAAPEVR
jgi:malonyl-CoA O-methyltransferase